MNNMPAEHRIDKKAQLIITTWRGEAHDVEFIDTIKHYQKNIQNHPDYIRFNEVVDLTKITNIKLTVNGIKNISSIASSTDKHRNNTKLAIIVSSNLAFGLSRMYETYRGFSKNANKEIRIFKNENDAFEWVTTESLIDEPS